MTANNTIPENQHRSLNFRKGEYLFYQNDSTKDLFVLKRGSIRIFKKEGDIEIDLDIIGSGHVVGEVAAIDGGIRTASAMALEDCEVICIPHSEFEVILSSIPEWFRKIALILVQRLREVDMRISRSIEGDRTNHIAAIISLLAFTDNCRFDNGVFVIDRKYAEYQIVDLLNIPLNEIAETLEKLQNQNHLRYDRTKIILSSREALDPIAERVFRSVIEDPVI